MMTAGEALTKALQSIAGCSGTIALAIERRRPVPRSQIAEMAARLRRAADVLESLLADK